MPEASRMQQGEVSRQEPENARGNAHLGRTAPAVAAPATSPAEAAHLPAPSQHPPPPPPHTPPDHPHLTATLLLSCLAQFMVILDVSVVNVALPSIRHGLGFSEVDLQWVVNAYTVTFGGFLLLG